MLELDGLKKNKLVGTLAREAARVLEQVQGQKMLQLQVGHVAPSAASLPTHCLDVLAGPATPSLCCSTKCAWFMLRGTAHLACVVWLGKGLVEGAHTYRDAATPATTGRRLPVKLVKWGISTAPQRASLGSPCAIPCTYSKTLNKGPWPMLPCFLCRGMRSGTRNIHRAAHYRKMVPAVVCAPEHRPLLFAAAAAAAAIGTTRRRRETSPSEGPVK